MKKFLFTLTFLSASLFSHAELNVIADLGGESAIPFYESIQPVHSESAKPAPNAIPKVVGEEYILPVVSHKLTPGKVSPISLNLPTMSPIFLAGVDNLSVRWIQKNYQKLIQLNAIGLVVQVNAVEELTQLRQLFPKLTFVPIPGDDMASRLRLSHYPALITEAGVSQ
ncbi:integrating conjugative element protein [Phocoenobacter skyensis]|uniref:integrating conjugative element protein n=1 Tax=Phocoenobacter skyensis TaxID=97481 RepID=UPI00276768E0|nr:integrating conjugative element protein [Pasteurella skyensis]MDP8185311.1 integrating conjugative element protein [Pasteurella skyensis]